MAATAASPTAYLLRNVGSSSFPTKSRFRPHLPAKRTLKFLAMSPKNKVLVFYMHIIQSIFPAIHLIQLAEEDLPMFGCPENLPNSSELCLVAYYRSIYFSGF